MSEQKNTITDGEFYKDTGVNVKSWDKYEKEKSPNINESLKETSKAKEIWNKIFVIGIFIIVIGLVAFFIWGFFFYEGFRGSSNPDDFVPDYMGGIN